MFLMVALDNEGRAVQVRSRPKYALTRKGVEHFVRKCRRDGDQVSCVQIYKLADSEKRWNFPQFVDAVYDSNNPRGSKYAWWLG